jgi:hypothetical protein
MRALAPYLMTAVALAGCQYSTAPTVTEPVQIYVSDTRKNPGKYLLYIDASELSRNVRASDFTCIAHTFPVDLREGFKNAVLLAVQQQFEVVETVPGPVEQSQLQTRGAAGMIQVTGLKLDAELTAVPGFLRNTMNTSVLLTAGLTVDGSATGRLLGTTVQGTGKAQADGGLACEGGSRAFQASSEAAIAEATREIVNAISNSQEIRQNR